MQPTHHAKALVYRRKAQVLGTLAACARSNMDRDNLLQMQAGCLSRAATEDWLDGLPPLPPARALAVPPLN
jgi:hypothetical protein